MVSDRTYSSASAVARAGRDLRDALDDPTRLHIATQRLASAGERSIAQFDETATAAFQTLGDQPSEPGREANIDDLLAAALGQIEVANTLLAASHAVGEQDVAEPAALDQQLLAMGNTVDLLGRVDAPPVQRFQAEGATSEDAVAALREQVAATLDEIATRSKDVLTRSITAIHEGGPAKLKQAWTWAKENLHLDEIGGRLAKLGLRALDAALSLLEKVFPGAELAAAHNDIEKLIEESQPGQTGSALVGVALGVPVIRQWVTDALGKPDLDPVRLSAGTGRLVALTAEHVKRMELWGAISTAIGVARTLTFVVRIAVPHLGLIIVGANLTVVGAVLTIGRKSTAAVRSTVSTATDQP